MSHVLIPVLLVLGPLVLVTFAVWLWRDVLGRDDRRRHGRVCGVPRAATLSRAR